MAFPLETSNNWEPPLPISAPETHHERASGSEYGSLIWNVARGVRSPISLTVTFGAYDSSSSHAMASKEVPPGNDNRTRYMSEIGKERLLRLIVSMGQCALRTQIVLSFLVADASRSLENATEWEKPDNMCSIALVVEPSLPSQILTVPSSDTDASCSVTCFE